ncbi:uncharacterized protein LOC124568623 [Schistocerca americana]|uniref:uncharacterized protein LOC124568623 n=1 Tax=Schistocerca americana TaxID=7009 RepID=UPI001F4F812E|nr:uncharacterized protein LOC124568623 [Schistocerca americana]
MHYINSDWRLNKYVLMCSAFPDCPKTGSNIRNELEDGLETMGVSREDIAKITFVTDQGTNIVKALEVYQRLPCMAHGINTVLKHVLSEQFLKENVPNILAILNTVRDTVSYFKRRGLCVRLNSSLKQWVSTRWNSYFDMLVSVHSQTDSVKAVLHNEGASDKMLGYDHHITGQLIEFLKPFKEATVDLESDKDPTLHLVLPWFYALKTHCTVRDNDEEDMKPLKQAADAFLEQKMCVSMLHKIATFTVANYRTLRKLTEDEKIEVYQAARQMCAEGVYILNLYYLQMFGKLRIV